MDDGDERKQFADGLLRSVLFTGACYWLLADMPWAQTIAVRLGAFMAVVYGLLLLHSCWRSEG